MPMFERYVGIDYSGAGKPNSPRAGIKVYVSQKGGKPLPQVPSGNNKNWSRDQLWGWLMTTFGDTDETPTLIGIDHAFSFPKSYFTANDLGSWDLLLEHFSRLCPTNSQPVAQLASKIKPPGPQTELRLTEVWARTAKSVFDFRPHGVAMSTFAGLPYIRLFRYPNPGCRHHFWPFDGWKIPAGRKVICEVYPTIYRGRCEFPGGLNEHERDAYVVTKWMQERDQADLLARYFDPPLLKAERAQADLEGWILGIA